MATNNTFISLLSHLNTLPQICRLTEGNYFREQYKLVVDNEIYFLLSFDDGGKHFYQGYFVEKDLVSNYSQKGIDLIKFEDGSGFVPHNLAGPAFFKLGSNPSYFVEGSELRDETEFYTHPAVKVLRNKKALKKKLDSL